MKKIVFRWFTVFLVVIFVGGVVHHNRNYIYHAVFFAKEYFKLSSRPDLCWTMINVNSSQLQGDAHLIQIKNGNTVLVDAGNIAPAKAQLIPFLKRNSISEIDKIFISHPHIDHYGGVRVLLDAGIKIKEIYFNIPNKSICDREIPWGCNYDDILETHQKLRKNGVTVKTIKANQSFDLGKGAIMKILYAFDGVHTPVGRTDINDLSLIMMLEYSEYKFLFTGDLNMGIGTYLSKVPEDLTANVIKVPHHGTEGLAPNSFFEKVNAEYALVPSPKHLWCSKRSSRARNWFSKNNTPVFVNGFHGDVKVVVNNGRLMIRPEVETEINCD